MISVEGLRVTFGARRVLDGVDLSIPDGLTSVVLGRSGIGKSVLLKAVLGLVPMSAGRVTVDGLCLQDLRPRARAEQTARIGMLLQNGGLFDSMTVFENIAFPLRYHRIASGSALEAAVREQAALVGLSDALEQTPPELSGGMRRRAALARCLVQKPTYLFYDEPTAGLDPGTSALVERLIRDVAEQRSLTSVIVTHDLDLVTFLGDRISLLEDGRIVASEDRTAALSAGSLIWDHFMTAREQVRHGH